MNGAEFLFSFFGLLLGLAVANVATGFGEMWRSRERWRVGYATPLLGLFVMLAVSQQWLAFWRARGIVDIQPGLLLAAIGVAFPYIFISSAMYPRSEDRYESHDEDYLAHSRTFMIALMIPTIVNALVNIGIGGTFLRGALPYYSLRLGIPLVLIFWRKLPAHYIGLMLLCLTMLVRIFDM